VPIEDIGELTELVRRLHTYTDFSVTVGRLEVSAGYERPDEAGKGEIRRRDESA
jgi:hypothetical protein